MTTDLGAGGATGSPNPEPTNPEPTNPEPTALAPTAPAPTATEAVVRQSTYWWIVTRRTWRGSIISTFLTPVLYLAAMGIGLGHYVDHRAGGSVLGSTSYLAFIAPGLMATTAMQNAVFESTYPVMAMFKWDKVYLAMLATPLRVRDVLRAHLAAVAVRIGVSLTILVATVCAFGVVTWWGAVPAMLGALLTGMAFAVPVFGMSARMRDESGYGLFYRLVLMPLFLFSGAFFPVTQLPAAMTWIAYLTPTWHGVDLCRQFTLGDPRPWSVLIHVAYLGCWIVVGGRWARIGFEKRLST